MQKKWMGIIGSAALVGGGILMAVINRGNPKYGVKWIQSLTDAQWEKEREIVRQKFCSPEYDFDSKARFQKILDLFDSVKSKRDWAGKQPQGPAFKREHGWYL